MCHNDTGVVRTHHEKSSAFKALNLLHPSPNLWGVLTFFFFFFKIYGFLKILPNSRNTIKVKIVH